MTENIVDVVITLRRDNDYNYEKVKDTFIPANGEPILVDTSSTGLRLKIGNGISTYSQLGYADEFIINGYYYNEKFYSDSNHTELIYGQPNRLYIDLRNSFIYYYDNEKYNRTVNSPIASSSILGIMKLYQTIGFNTDGTMTQKAITEGLNEKFEVNVDASEETIIFANKSRYL